MVAGAERWLRYQQRVAAPSCRLVCLPHAGGNASFFHGWAGQLPASVELISVRYPGREDRLREPFITELTELADQVADVLHQLASVPLVLFGHSMGASVAHEVTARLERRGQSVAALLVSARPAPQQLRPDSERRTLADPELIADIKRLDARSAAVLDQPELLQVVLPAIRADYGLVDGYPRQPPRVVRAPIVGYAGDTDPDVSPADMGSWQQATTGSFQLRLFAGDHFYLVPQQAALVADISDRVLSRLSSETAGPCAG